jgi:hypothetical protein
MWEDVYQDLDNSIDPWGYGRNSHGRLDNKALRASYPFVEVSYRDETKIQKILQENFRREHLYHSPYLHRRLYVFFQTEEDMHLFYGLQFVY